MREGFIYIWRDRLRNMYYIGCHYGTEDDGYVCSNARMKKAYKHRPQDFKRRILQRGIDRSVLMNEEYKWLRMISEEELGEKYYNLTNRQFGHWSINEDSRLSAVEKTAKFHRGRKRSIKTCDLMKENHTKPWTGRTHSDETKSKMSASMKGKKHTPTFGRVVTEEMKAKMRETYQRNRMMGIHNG